MKKLFAIVVSALLVSAGTARAEHKLLVTEVLNPGQVEGQAGFEYSHRSFDLTVGGERGKAYANATESRYSLNVGVLRGLEIDASVPYVFNEQLKIQLPAGAEYEKRDGFGDVTLGAKYSLTGEHAPVAAVIGVDVKLDSAARSDAGSGTTDVSPYVAVSKKLGHHDIPYAIYRYTISNHGAADTHAVAVGLEHELNETVTFDVRFDGSFRTASPTLASQDLYTLDATSYLQVARNFYLLPSVALLLSSGTHSKVADIDAGSGLGFRAGLSLYYLY